MKYIVTESQINRLWFVRRHDMFEQVLKRKLKTYDVEDMGIERFLDLVIDSTIDEIYGEENFRLSGNSLMEFYEDSYRYLTDNFENMIISYWEKSK